MTAPAAKPSAPRAAALAPLLVLVLSHCRHAATEPAEAPSVTVPPAPRAAPGADHHDQPAAPRSFGEALAGCRSAPNGEHCYYAGKVLSELASLISRCRRGDQQACQHVPPAFAKYAPDQLDDSATELFERGCAADHGESCARAGAAHAIDDRPELAEQNFEKACKLGSTLGCRFRGTTTPAE